jgi:hypothetical protein
VYYVDAGSSHPERSLSGVLEFLDSASRVEAGERTGGSRTANPCESGPKPD